MKIDIVLYSSQDRNWKISDFGFHEIIARNDQEGRFNPGEGYKPPETFYDGSEMDQRSDIWNMGCIMFELATGQRPFHDDKAAWSYARGTELAEYGLPGIKLDIDEKLLVSPRWFAQDVSELISNMLNKDPSARRFASELLHKFYLVIEKLNA